jgi:hypothetical protein
MAMRMIAYQHVGTFSSNNIEYLNSLALQEWINKKNKPISSQYV